jgi:hypothetical protein
VVVKNEAVKNGAASMVAADGECRRLRRGAHRARGRKWIGAKAVG